MPSSKPTTTTTPNTTATTDAAFRTYYLQRVTEEFSDDLDRIRTADDFRPDSSVPALVGALEQGAALYSSAQRARIVGPRKDEEEEGDDDDEEEDEREGSAVEAEEESETSSEGESETSSLGGSSS